MATFIMKGRYSTEAIKRISGERTTKATDIVQQCGGKLVAAYATMGETDLLAFVEFLPAFLPHRPSPGDNSPER